MSDYISSPKRRILGTSRSVLARSAAVARGSSSGGIPGSAMKAFQSFPTESSPSETEGNSPVNNQAVFTTSNSSGYFGAGGGTVCGNSFSVAEDRNLSTGGSSEHYQHIYITGEGKDADFATSAPVFAKVINSRSKYFNISVSEGCPPKRIEGWATTDDGPTQPGAASDALGASVHSNTVIDDSDIVKGSNKSRTSKKKSKKNGVEMGSSSSFTQLQSVSTWPKNIKFNNGVFTVSGVSSHIISWHEYVCDMNNIYALLESGPCLTAARARLYTLEEKFEVYKYLNTDVEEETDIRRKSAGAFAGKVAVDNNVRLATLVDAKGLVQYIKTTAEKQRDIPFLWRSQAAAAVTEAAAMARKCALRRLRGSTGGADLEDNNTTASFNEQDAHVKHILDSNMKSARDSCFNMSNISSPLSQDAFSPLTRHITSTNPPLQGDPVITLGEFLDIAGVSAENITVESLGLCPDLVYQTSKAVNVFNASQNPSGTFGASILRGFLTRDTPSRGRLLAAAVRPAFVRQEEAVRAHSSGGGTGGGRVTASAVRIPLSGTFLHEWTNLADWLSDEGFLAFQSVGWIIDISRTPVSTHPCVFSSADNSKATVRRGSAVADDPNPTSNVNSSAEEQPCKTYADQLYNIFYPMLMASLHPEDPEWSTIALALQHVHSINIYSEELNRDADIFKTERPPQNFLFVGGQKQDNDSGGGGDCVFGCGGGDRNKSGIGAGVANDKDFDIAMNENNRNGGGRGKMGEGRNDGRAQNKIEFPQEKIQFGSQQDGGINDYYYYYYVWANLKMLNAIRRLLRLNTFTLSVSCNNGAAHWDQLVSGFLLCDHVLGGGRKLDTSWALQYVYYLVRLGLVLSPLSDSMQSSYYTDPLLNFFRRGLNVALATSDPLYTHASASPLSEEYATFMRICDLTPTDAAEIASNSVSISNISLQTKAGWAGRRCNDEDETLALFLAQAGEGGVGRGAVGVAGAGVLAAGGAGHGALSHGPLMTRFSRLSEFRIRFRIECLSTEQATINFYLIKKDPLLAGDQLIRGAVSAARRGSKAAFGGPDTVPSSSLPTLSLTRSNPNVDSRVKFQRVAIRGGPCESKQFCAAAESLGEVLRARHSYLRPTSSEVMVEDVFTKGRVDESSLEYGNYYGIFLVSSRGHPPVWPSCIPSITQFIDDCAFVKQVVVGNADVVRLARHRLELLERLFKLHFILTCDEEVGVDEGGERDVNNNHDLYTARKVDNNVQTECGMNSRTLLDFFSEKALHNGADIVTEEEASPGPLTTPTSAGPSPCDQYYSSNNKGLHRAPVGSPCSCSSHDPSFPRGSFAPTTSPVSLTQLLERLAIDPHSIAVDELHALVKGSEQVKRIFFSVDNYMQGRYFAELTRRTFDLYAEDQYTFSEGHLAVTGASRDEWTSLALWESTYGVSSRQNKWIVNIRRSYRRLRQAHVVRNFGEFIDNVFGPLWEVSLHPAKGSKLHSFLTHVSGFDCTDDESKVDMPLTETFPHNWDTPLNPPYNYYLYYIWANIVSLNLFRSSRGLSTFVFRPQCGELGGVDHLIGGFLLTDGISHGISLRQYPAMQYLFYLARVGIAMSPLSNTTRGISYIDHPFPHFFRAGLRVSLSTDTPLFTHFTREPLLEEYSVAAKLWTLEHADLCEIARNSVLLSGFGHEWKEEALGDLYLLDSPLGNDTARSHVSDIRVAFRFETYHAEVDFLDALLRAAHGDEEDKGGDGGGGAGGGGERRPSISGPTPVMPRAMRMLDDEALVFERVRGYPADLPPLDSNVPVSQRTTKAAGEGIQATAERLRAEVEQLEAELVSAKVRIQHISDENLVIGSSVNLLRRRMKNEPLIVRANLPPEANYVEDQEMEEYEEFIEE